jgi:hypothetical protein
MILCKDDVRFKRLTPEIVHVFGVLEKVFAEHAPDVEIVITSAHDGTHKTDSYHYIDYAIDVRSHSLSQITKGVILAALRAELAGLNYDVILEGLNTAMEHFHIEFNARQVHHG